MLNRNGTRLEIGVADDIAELDNVEREARRKGAAQTRTARMGDPYATSLEPASISPPAAMRETTPQPTRRVPATSRNASSTPPPPPML
jgi:hypothetical protein